MTLSPKTGQKLIIDVKNIQFSLYQNEGLEMRKTYKVLSLNPNNPEKPLFSHSQHAEGDQRDLEKILNDKSEAGWSLEHFWNNQMILSRSAPDESV